VKKYLFLIIALLLGSQFLSAQNKVQSPLKIGYVDSQVILTQLPEAIKAQGDLDALTNKWTTQIDSMTKSLQSEYDTYQKQSANMPEDKKNAAQQAILAKQQEIENFRRSKFQQGTGELYKKNEEIFNPIKEKIYKAIGEIAKKEGMQFVFDKTGDVVLLYADASFDVTYQVLDQLKRGGK
jgi:outer membrane protein